MSQRNLQLYNTLKRVKQPFKPLVEGHVGMYVCGPTVYGDAHLGKYVKGIKANISESATYKKKTPGKSTNLEFK